MCPWCKKETEISSVRIGNDYFPIIDHVRRWEGNACPGPDLSKLTREPEFAIPGVW
jgi:hypothetical protein